MPEAVDTGLVHEVLRSPQAPRIHEELGRRLQEEAERRAAFVEAVTEDDKAEFINGAPVYHSPARAKHNDASGRLFTLLHLHVAANDLGRVGTEKWMVSLTRNDYEPDVCFWRRSVAASFTPDQMRFPAPDFVAEVLSDSTRTTDLGIKREDYAAHGVAEYWTIDPDARTVSQHLLPEGGTAYDLALRSDSGVVRSAAVRGFVLLIPALFDDGAFGEALNVPR